MSNTLKVFNFESNEVRTLLINNEPWFVGKDVATVLGYADTKKAIKAHVDEEDKIMGGQNGTPSITDSLGREQFPTYVNESGLYSLIMGSKLPSAKKFKRWVTSEVLPTLRKTGRYSITDSYMIKDPIERAKRWIEEEEERQALRLENAEMKPKALFADAMDVTKGSVPVGELSKILAQNGIEIGRNKLFEWLRDNGYLIKCGDEKNLPMQKYTTQGMGLFEIKPQFSHDSDGNHIERKSKTCVTCKGQKYFINKFLKLNDKGVM